MSQLWPMPPPPVDISASVFENKYHCKTTEGNK